MKLNDGLMRQLASDLGLNVRFEKGSVIPVKNCWHFMTDGNAVDVLFRDKEDFCFGMNLIYLMSINYKAVVLAFALMDTHVHFILYGEFDECNRMMHEYVRRLSIYMANKYDIHDIFASAPLMHQVIGDADYLKTAICYVIKNATVAGLPFNPWDYPWSSGPLYFRTSGFWNSFDLEAPVQVKLFKVRELNDLFHSGYSQTDLSILKDQIRMIGNIVFPGEYVAWEVVEKLFRTNRSYNFFLGRSKESDVDSRGGSISYLTIPMQEMRVHKRELCMEMFGVTTIKELDMSRRLKLARVLKSKYNSSKKQIARVCGLVYTEVENML